MSANSLKFAYLKCGLLLGMGIGLALVYFIYSPSESGYFPACIFLKKTGWLCPACGTQRALHALLHFEFSAALDYNVLMVLGMPLVLFGLLLESLQHQSKIWKERHDSYFSPLARYTAVGVILFFWIVRNV